MARHLSTAMVFSTLIWAGTCPAQDVYRSFSSPLHIKAVWNDLPVLAITNDTRVILDYEKATFEIMFDPSSLRCGVPALDSIFIAHQGAPIVFTGKLLGMNHIETKKHPPLDFDVEGRLAHMDVDEPIIGRGHLEHIFAGQYACLLEITFIVPVTRFHLDESFPGLSGNLTFHVIQTLLKRQND
ncbi:MAG: hypothetical protein JNL05_14040 [Flavobacteriales bacterium]|nr:hypothetical protein [Flavobacteriales bacterium]